MIVNTLKDAFWLGWNLRKHHLVCNAGDIQPQIRKLEKGN